MTTFVNGLVEEKSRMGKIKCESDYLVHVRKKTIKFEERISGGQFNKIKQFN